MANRLSRRKAQERQVITESEKAFDHVTRHGNWSEIIVKLYNFHRSGLMALREVTNTKTRALSIIGSGQRLVELGECLKEIAYKETKNEDISESKGDGEGSGEGSVRNGDEVSD